MPKDLFLIGFVETDKDGKVLTKNVKKSAYQPPKDVVDLLLNIKQDYQLGINIQNDPYREFNDLSFLQERSISQKAFLNYTEAPDPDPDLAWHWKGVRPITRNKIISMAAHVTAQTIFPGVFAQNPDDEKEDVVIAEAMESMIEWNIRNSDYELDSLYGVIAALVGPVA